MYSLPVLLSGIPSLLLSSSEVNIVDSHHRKTLNSLLKLYPSTPHAFTYFIAGSLPARAIVHQRQLGLFNMVWSVTYLLIPSTKEQSMFLSRNSWFTQLRDICLLYYLPHPLELLNNPLSKEYFKSL